MARSSGEVLGELDCGLDEWDRDVDCDMLTLKRRLNRHRTEIDRADDHVGLFQLCGNRGLIIF